MDGTVPSLALTELGPKRAYFGAEPVAIGLELASGPAVDVVLSARSRAGRGLEVWREEIGDLGADGQAARVIWNGMTKRGRPARDGRYAMVATVAGIEEKLGVVSMHGHFFPVRGPHRPRGWLGEFGAPRSGGRRHLGFDVNASCGTPIASVRAGRVLARGYDPNLYGNYVRIAGAHERRSYFYAHMSKPARPALGTRVATGEVLGRVGLTGNAAGTPCHLHFEMRVKGRTVDPARHLRAWDRHS